VSTLSGKKPKCKSTIAVNFWPENLIKSSRWDCFYLLFKDAIRLAKTEKLKKLSLM